MSLEIGRTRAVLFSLLPLVLLLGVAELVLRLVGFGHEAEALQVEYTGSYTQRMFQGHLSSDHFTRDAVTFWKPKATVAPFNALGYRGDEVERQKASGEFRLLAVGDSNTLGHEASWVNEIPGFLKPGDLGAERLSVINAGVYGFTSFQGVEHLKRFLPYGPDVVLISFGGNDAATNSLPDKDYKPYVPHPVYAWFDRRVAIVNLMESLSLRGVRPSAGDSSADGAEPTPEPQLVSRVALDDYDRNLALMVALARDAGAVPILMTRPLVYDYHAPASDSPTKPYYFKTLEVAQREGVGLLDVDVMANHSWVLYGDHSHFNVEGHRVLAEYIAAALPRLAAGAVEVVDEPRFRPRNRDERATHVVGRHVNRWRPLEQNLRALKATPWVRRIVRVHESTFENGEDRSGWRVSFRPRRQFSDHPARVGDGRLCVSEGPETISLFHDGLGLDASSPHLIWLEAETRSDLAFEIAWNDDGGPDFDRRNAVVATFYAEKTDVPVRMFHVLPSGTSGVRIEGHLFRWGGDVCFTEIVVVRLEGRR